MHALNEIRNHDPSFWAGEDSSCLRPRGYCDRLASERAKTVHALDRAATDRLASERAKTVHALDRAATDRLASERAKTVHALDRAATVTG
jgi:hypothetical protein